MPDGLKVDMAGNVYTGGAGGLFIMDKTARSSDASCTGSRDNQCRLWRRRLEHALFHHAVFADMVSLKIAGVPVPARRGHSRAAGAVCRVIRCRVSCSIEGDRHAGTVQAECGG